MGEMTGRPGDAPRAEGPAAALEAVAGFLKEVRGFRDEVKSVMQALIQADRYGTPVAQALRVLAQESRDQRMNEAEKKAAALPPKLTVPMTGGSCVMFRSC